MKVRITVNPVSGMYETVTEVPPCTDEACKRRRLRDAQALRSPIASCHGECAWVDGYEGWGCSNG